MINATLMSLLNNMEIFIMSYFEIFFISIKYHNIKLEIQVKSSLSSLNSLIGLVRVWLEDGTLIYSCNLNSGSDTCWSDIAKRCSSEVGSFKPK